MRRIILALMAGAATIASPAVAATTVDFTASGITTLVGPDAPPVTSANGTFAYDYAGGNALTLTAFSLNIGSAHFGLCRCRQHVQFAERCASDRRSRQRGNQQPPRNDQRFHPVADVQSAHRQRKQRRLQFHHREYELVLPVEQRELSGCGAGTGDVGDDVARLRRHRLRHAPRPQAEPTPAPDCVNDPTMTS